MSFSPAVKDKAMNACARYCCVCHKYKGVKIELHHIDPHRLLGKNTFENGIPLCFDCHSDAGHYFALHPRGTKYSPSELKSARDNWYKFVKNNSIVEKVIISEHIQTNYYILHSFDALEELLLQNDFTSFNKFRTKTFLSANEVSTFWGNLLLAHKNDYGISSEQISIVEFRQFETLKEYQEKYDNVELIDKTTEDHPYYEATRKLKWDELLSDIKPNSFLKLLSSSVIEPDTCCISYLHKNGASCGGETPETGYSEYIEITPISFVFLGITNASKEQIKLNYLHMNSSNSNGDLYKVKLPNFNLMAYEMVLIPVSTNLNCRRLKDEEILLDFRDGDRSQDFSRILNILNSENKDIIFIGNALKVKSIIYNDNKGEYEVPVHELDFNNLYTINRDWQCGSCPHLFFILENGKQHYFREILKNASNSMGVDKLVIPKGVVKVIIRELEQEVTNIIEIKMNDIIIINDVKLCEGEKLTFDVCSGDSIEISGIYYPIYKGKSKINDMWFRNNLIEYSNKYNNCIK